MSKKRAADSQGGKNDSSEPLGEEELEFEDPYGDEYEDEPEVNDEQMDTVQPDAQSADANAGASEQPQVVKQVWKSGVQKLEDIEDLEYDPSAYIMYHAMQTEWPCLSFDFFKDDLGEARHRVRVYYLSLLSFCSAAHDAVCLAYLAVPAHYVYGHWIAS